MLTYLALKAATILSRRLGRRGSYALATVLGLLFFAFNRSARADVRQNVVLALEPGASRRRVNTVVRKVFINLTKDYADLVLLATGDVETFEHGVTVEGLEHLRQAREAGKGALAVFFHLAGFNMACGAALQADGMQASVLTEPLKPERLRRLVDGLRSSPGVGIIPADSGATRRVLRTLRDNGLVGLAADRWITGPAVPVEMFEQTVEMPLGAAAIGLRSGAAILPVVTMRCPDDRVYIRVCPRLRADRRANFDSEVSRITRELARIFEAHLRRHPEQWVLVHPVRANPWPPRQPAAAS